MPRPVSPAVLLVCLLAPLSSQAAPRGGASPAGSHAPGDPWERANRRTFAFNQVIDRIMIRPLSRLTSGLTPGPIGKAIHNFLVNLNEPVVIVNDLLQARPGPAARSAVRLVVNTTVGVLGAVDVAKAMGDPAHVNGFGDTLGRWGVGSGPYMVLPVVGPSSTRDLLGMLVDDATLPIRSVSYPYRTEVDITVSVVGGLNQRADADRDLKALLNDATDPYATLRSSYLQAREAQIRGPGALPTLPDIEDAPGAAAPTPAPSATPAPSSPPDPPPPAP